MSATRREFLKNTSLAAAALATSRPGECLASPIHSPPASNDPQAKELCMAALDAAASAGARYVDARVMRRREQWVGTREQRVTQLRDDETVGIAVRVLVDGAWGFVASRTLDREEAVRVARASVEQAAANARAIREPVRLAPVDAYPNGEWQTPVRIDPFEVAVEDKITLLLAANAEALKVPGARFASSSMAFVRLDTTFASTDGSLIEQTLYRTWPSMSVTAVAPDRSDFQSRTSAEVAPMGMGYEHVEGARLVERAGLWAQDAVQKLAATPVEPGEYDLILDPSHLFLTIHENIGHPTELDRAMGFEANYAGTSFLAPPEQVLGRFQYGPEIMNVQADRTQRGGLATVGWDDEGVPADSWPLIKDGTFVDYQTTREQVAWISDITGIRHSHGCSFAQSWDKVQFQRMPNISLLPGENDYTLDDLVAATDRGILIKGRGSYSIDQQRYNFQFGGQVFYEIRDGAIVGMLKDVAYQGRTPEFWNSLDMLGGPRSYQLGGTFYDGKGQPAQSNAVSHGCPPARFRGVTVINTGAR
jgi:TldD protein